MTAPAPPAAAAADRGTALALRLLAVLVLIFGAAALTFTLLARGALERSREQQVLDAREHFTARVALQDERWLEAAFALRQQVELWQAVGSTTPASGELLDASLRALLVTLLGEGDFSHVAIVDDAGVLLFRHGTRSRYAPTLPSRFDELGRGWAFSGEDRTVHRAVIGPVRYGARSARLIAYAPIDIALLRRMVYPNTDLSLAQAGRVVASAADGGASSREATAADTPTRGRATLELPWDGAADSPHLLIERQFLVPVSDRELLFVVAACAGSFLLVGWLALGRWVRSLTRRLNSLQQVAQEFTHTPRLQPGLDQRLGDALASADDVGALARNLRSMMQRIEQARTEEARAREALQALNAGLESRVSQRTRELEQARDEALAAARTKEQFLSNMSHELRTPMNGLLGALELLARTPLTGLQAEYIRVASTSGEALLEILNAVLDFAKIGAGQLQLAHEPLDVNAIARTVTTLFSAAAQRKALGLRLEADPALSGWRRGDALRLRQVLMNLVGNALKFTQQGEIVVRTHCLDGPQGARVAFAVSDTGVGIEASQHQRIFEPFQQAEHPARARPGGTGLGLAICRELVQAMGGDIVLDSAAGRGATFSFELPLEPTVAGTVPAPRPTALASAMPLALGGRVLLVEDNSVNRLVGSAMLEALGIEVLQAEHGAQALEVWARTPVSVVLMDCQMPVMDGYEATQRLREQERLQGLARTPVIALTANALSGDADRCLAAGMDAYLPKPYTLEQLRDTLAPWMTAAG